MDSLTPRKICTLTFLDACLFVEQQPCPQTSQNRSEIRPKFPGPCWLQGTMKKRKEKKITTIFLHQKPRKYLRSSMQKTGCCREAPYQQIKAPPTGITAQ